MTFTVTRRGKTSNPATRTSTSTCSRFRVGLSVFRSRSLRMLSPLKTAVWITSLIGSWIAFVLCILATLLSFRLSIMALERTIPALGEYYLDGKQDAFNRHLKTLSVRALGWCTAGQGTFFAVRVILTMTFVFANVWEGRVSKDETTQKEVTSDLGKGLKPVGRTPLPMSGQEDRGLKPSPMTPVAPAQPTQPATPPQPAQSPNE